MNSLSANDRAQVIQDATSQFWKHISPIVRIAFAIHVLLFGLFGWLGISVMWAANGLSILAYVACLRSIRRGWYRTAGMLMSVEIIAHAAIATWIFGWESNFYFYVFCVIPIIAFSFQSARIRRLSLSFSILALVVGGYAWRRHMGSPQLVSEDIIDVFGVANALTATALLLHATALSVRFTLSMQLNLFHTANRDSLTNLYTRRRVLQRLRQLGADRVEQSTSMVMIDIDHFKQINDRHGHESGDVVLQRVATVISECVRATDIAARWGGEEFLILMPATAQADAMQVAQRVLKRIREEAGLVHGSDLAVTATLAVAAMQTGETFRDTLNRADQTLYLGKQEGRDRVMLAQ
jgi:diguanylate cyclase (GGDEF)-like protein